MLPSSGRGFYDPHSEMNRLFDEMLGGLNRRSGGQQRAQGSQNGRQLPTWFIRTATSW